MFGRKKKNLASLIDKEHLPHHIGIIMDGNGRWAKKRGMPRSFGHSAGAKKFDDIIDFAGNFGIKVVTVYAFSTENWNRPKEEVDALMKLLRNYMKNCLKRASKNNMCVRVIGEKSRLDDDIRESIEELENATKDNTGLHFTIAINYGGRDELVRATRKIAEKVANGEVKPEEIMEVAKLVCADGDTCGNMPFEVTPEDVYAAILAADEIGKYLK